MPVLFLLQTAFSVWMLLDAIKRRTPEYWWIIIFIPLGAWVYFVAIKLPDVRYSLGRTLLAKRTSLDHLRARLRETPSHENRVRLAQSLHDHQKYQEASELFEKVLRNDEDDKESLYGYALCSRHIGEREMAARALERLIDIDITYLDHAPCEDLAALYQEDGKMEQAVALLQKACHKSQRIGPRRMLASYLADLERVGEARSLLRDGLESYGTSPHFVKRRDRREAREARALLRSLE